MPQVEVAPKTYAALQQVASETGMSVEKALEQAVLRFASVRSMPEEAYQQAWDKVLAEIRANLPPGVTAEEVERDIDAATDEVWAERRARRR